MSLLSALVTAWALSALVTAWALGALAFTLLTLYACARLERVVAAQTPPARWPRLWILRPCEGDEPGLLENLRSSLAHYAGERRVLLLVPSVSDASHAAAQTLAAECPDVEVLVTEVETPGNRKSVQLARGLAHVLAERLRRDDDDDDASRDGGVSNDDVIVQADSDVRLDDRSLPSLLTALGDDPRVAASFAVPVELEVESAGDLAASGLLSASHQSFFALAALSRLVGGVTSLAGALAAHRLSALEQTGGFAPLEQLLGEDFEVGRRLHAAGHEVAVAREPARSVEHDRPLAAVVARTTRWATVVKQQRPGLVWTYPLLLAASPLVAAAALAIALASDAGASRWVPLFGAAALVLGRVLLARRLRRIHGAPASPLGALALEMAAELLMLAASARALFTSHVTWRGRRLRIGQGGVIEPAPRPASQPAARRGTKRGA